MSVSKVWHKYSLLFLYPVFDVYMMSFFKPKMYSLEIKLQILKIMVMQLNVLYPQEIKGKENKFLLCFALQIYFL